VLQLHSLAFFRVHISEEFFGDCACRMAAAIAIGSVTMYLHHGKHVTHVGGSAAHMAATVADAVARAPRMHHHAIIATDSAHRLAAEDCAWRPMHGGHELIAVVDRTQLRKTSRTMVGSLAPNQATCSEARTHGVIRAVVRWRNLKAVKHSLLCEAGHTPEVSEGDSDSHSDAEGTLYPLTSSAFTMHVMLAPVAV
jgi:hypothetical protein